ncbi:MAG: ABC transporter substrate-binding protein [Ilumatobacteraceae bacterium]
MKRSVAGLLAAMVALSGCLSDGSTTTTASTAATAATSTTMDQGPGFTIPPPPSRPKPWAVDTTACADAASADTEITGTLTIGTTAPQSGGLVTTIYGPVLAGFRAYVDVANAQGLLAGVALELVVADDEGRPELTPVAVSGLLDAGADVVSALPGSANNLAVRDLLNDACVPQLMSLARSVRLGEVRQFPWTMGGLVTSVLETTVYVNTIVRSIDEDATVALLVSNDDTGTSYARSFLDAAADTDLSIVEQQLVEPDVVDAPARQVLIIASRQPQVIVASLSGAACATFLTELDRVRVALPGWEPFVYVSSDCADATVLGLAGLAADGVMSSAALVSEDPDFIASMRVLGITTGFTRAADGWTAAEVTVAILASAQLSPQGLTRATIINAARNLAYTPSLARPGVEYVTNGVDDAYPVESLQVVRWDATKQMFGDVGALVAQFES